MKDDIVNVWIKCAFVLKELHEVNKKYSFMDEAFDILQTDNDIDI